MSDRAAVASDRIATMLVAIALAGYGAYRALFIPALLVGPPAPILLIGFLLQAVLGIVAGVGVWRAAGRAPLAILLLGVSVAGTALVEGFVLGIVAYLRALLEALLGMVVAVLLAVAVRGRLGTVPA